MLRLTDEGLIPKIRIHIIDYIRFFLYFLYKFLNMCPFDFTAVAVSGKVGYP